MRRLAPTRILGTAIGVGGAAGVIALACVSGEFADGLFLCEPAGGADACPDGMVCASDGRCRRSALADAGPDDARGEEDEPVPCTDATCPEGSTCTDGVCVPICEQATWRWEAPPDVVVGGVVRGPGRDLWVGGKQGESAWVGRFDACTGFVTSSVFDVPGVSGASADALAIDDGALYAVGSASVDIDVYGIVARLDPQTLEVVWSQALNPTSGLDIFSSVAVPPGGPAWVGGIKDAFGPSAGWGLKATPAGDICELATAPWTNVGAVGASGTSIYLGATEGGHAELVRYDEPCSTSPACGCDYNWKANDILIGAATTELAGVVRVGEMVYVAGHARDDGNWPSRCFLLWMDANASSPSGIELWDPTPDGDWVSRMAADDDTLFLAVSTGSTKAFDLVSTSITLEGIVLPPGARHAPEWSTTLPLNVATGLATETYPGDGLYVAGRVTDGANTVARCTKQGDCPKW